MKTFNAGDKVRFISTKGSGIVTSVKNNIVNVLIEDGFEIPVEASDLVVIEPQEGKRNPFTRKDEFSKIEKPQTKPVATESAKTAPVVQPEKKETLPKVVPTKGIYLVFVPENQELLITGNIEVYLVNFTAWQVAYHLMKTHPLKGYESVSGGLMESGDAILIETLNETEVKNWNHLKMQFLCLDPKNCQVFDAEVIELNIKTSKFIKEDIFMVNPFFDELAHMIFVHDLTHPPLAGKDAGAPAVVIEKTGKSLIDQYMVDKDTAEVDLHIEKLRSDYRTMKKDDIMPVQLARFRQFLDASIAKGLRKVVFIHGVGAGLLKKELTDILKSYPDLEFEDASIMKYGIGATEVRIPKR